MTVTIFKDLKNTYTPFYKDINYILSRIKNGKSKDLVLKIRSKKTKKDRDEIKKELPCICFSGTFKKRNDKSLEEHSGFICLDFDNFKSNEKLLSYRDKLIKDNYTFSLFISPSGEGLKCLVKIPKDEINHKLYFDALEEHYNVSEFDTTSKNVSRICFESYDPDLYINQDSLIWDKKKEIDNFVYDKEPDIKLEDERDIIQKIDVWFNKNYTFNKGSRNHNLYIYASALNDYGVGKHLAYNHLRQFQAKDFNATEIERTIDSAYRNTANFGVKFFEDNNKKRDIKVKAKSGYTVDQISSDLKIEPDDVKKIVSSDTEFWYKDKRGKVHITNILFKKFLEDNGFLKFYPENSENFVFVKRDKNLIEDTNEFKIKDFVMDYLINLKDTSVYEYFADKTKYFKEDYLSFLENADLLFNQDTRDKCYIYFKNTCINVTKNNIQEIDYLELNGFVWKRHIIDFDFDLSDNDDNDFKKMVWNISGENKDNYNSIRSAIGYLLHSYKNNASNKAIILNDETISDNPNGGTGKGIFINAISKLKRSAIIDGKSFSFEKSFPYQTVSADTQMLVFDDVLKNFQFERLFSLITEGITLEKKNKDAIKIPVERSPKVLISTNYALGGEGASFERRMFELEFKQYYKPNFTPYDEFKRYLFDDWNDKEWNSFYNFMINCVQFYLKNGLVESNFNNLERRKLTVATNYDFLEWVEDGNYVVNERMDKSDKYNSFVEEYPDFKRWLTRKRFDIWMNKFGEYKGYEVNKGKSNSIRWVEFLDGQEKSVDIFDNDEDIF